MKLTVFAALLWAAPSAVQAKFTLERNLQSCPEPNADTPCTLESAPVKCGSMACEYPNQCSANAAGYTPGVCWPATCTAPAADTPCTFNLNPVLCGDAKCEYDNYCVAEAAGFPNTVCEAVNCPAPGEVMCTMEYDPFVCFAQGVGLCGYDNGCLATSSGFDTADTNQCVRLPEFVANNLGDCPQVGSANTDSIACPLNYDPLRCGDNCVYANECEASSAGFNPNDPFVCQSAYCALPNPEILCTKEFAPVRCGLEGCSYSNQCEATSAGYSEADCGDANCPVPDLSIPCSREYDPHTCNVQGVECTYDNFCAVGAAGQSEANCVPVNDPTNPEVCPVPDPNTQCTREVDEIVCGDKNDCFYSNYCLANAAGFENPDCRSAYCEASTATLDDCADFGDDTVVCGPYECPYFSSCVANRAGYAPVECRHVDCPIGSGACTLEYVPIVCADAEFAEGAPCAYSNACLAGLAGYNTDQQAGQCVVPLLPAPTRQASFDPVPAMNTTEETDGDMDGGMDGDGDGDMDGDTDGDMDGGDTDVDVDGDTDGDADGDGEDHDHEGEDHDHDEDGDKDEDGEDGDSDAESADEAQPLESSGSISLAAAKGGLMALALAYLAH